MKTNAKVNLGHHVKNIHHVTKRTHELFKNSKICNYTNALLLILILSVAILATQMFINNQNKVVPDAEIRFSELSKDNKIVGSIMPASCESNPNVSNGDGNFTGCATETCWNGSVITPAANQVCPIQPRLCTDFSFFLNLNCYCIPPTVKVSNYGWGFTCALPAPKVNIYFSDTNAPDNVGGGEGGGGGGN